MVRITRRGKRAWVTFTLGGDGFESARIKGEWNGWQDEAMKRKRDGDFYIVKVLPVGERFEFGYLVDEGRWMNDEALPTTGSPFGSTNSVLTT